MADDNELIVEIPYGTWRQFPDGKLLKAEMERLGAEKAEGDGRKVKALTNVKTDWERDVYVVTFSLRPR